MSKILLLDCTLRDGGYVNDWNFGERGIAEMLDALAASRVDAIEVGFLVDGNADDPARTRFSSVEKMAAAFPRGKPAGTLAFGMVVFGKYPIEKIPPRERGGIDGIRVTFKKNERDAALEFCRRVQELGYLVSVNPTGADAYGDREFLEIVESVNAMRPFAFAIVDTLGAMKRRDVARLCMLIDHNLHPDVALCFHSHNNLQLSFANALEVMAIPSARTFIIDTCVFGMGRGAGNLCTELMMRHLNDREPGRYDLIPVLRVIDERVSRIFARSPWGYSVPYYLAAVNRCHPNYASFLLSKQTLPVTGIDALLKRIPPEKRNEYDKAVIERLYLQYQAHAIDDAPARERLRAAFSGRKLLVLAPGKSLVTEAPSIRKFIEEEKPVVVAINAAPPDIRADFIFVSNAKRFSELSVPAGTQVILTSNVPNAPADALRADYASYLNDSALADNAALMLFALLERAGVADVAVAGLDGFSSGGEEDYFSRDLANPAKREGGEDARNALMREQLGRFASRIAFRWITPSRYAP